MSHGHGERRAGLARRIAMGVVLACLLGATLAASAVARPSRTDSTFTAIDARSGKALPHDPVLHRGQRVIVTVRGFASHASVRVALVRVHFYGTVRADRHGHVGFPFAVPRTLRSGRHVLIFSGLPAALERASPKPQHGTETRDPQVFVVTVPFDPPWPFRLGAATPHPPPSHGTGGQHGSHGGGTSFTGVDIAALVLAALLVLAVGVAASCVARRHH